MPDDVSVAAVEEALRLAATSMHEQLAAIDEAVAYHEGRARELRETRKRVARVEAIVNAPPDGRRNNGGARGARSAETLAKISERTKQRHREERQLKKDRVREYVQGLGPSAEVTGKDVAAALTDSSKPKNDPARLGSQLANDLLRELRDEGTLRLDRKGFGGQSFYRLVVS